MVPLSGAELADECMRWRSVRGVKALVLAQADRGGAFVRVRPQRDWAREQFREGHRLGLPGTVGDHFGNGNFTAGD